MSDHPPPTPLRGSPLKRMKRRHTSSPSSASATSAPSSPAPRLQGSPASRQAASQHQSTTPPTTPLRIANSDEEDDDDSVTSPTPKARPQAGLRLAAPVAREALQVLDLCPFIEQGQEQEGLYGRLPITDNSSERATRASSSSPSLGNSIDQDALFDQAQQMDGEASDSDSSLDVNLIPKAWDGDKGAMPSPRTAHARMRKFQDRTVKKLRKAFQEFMGDALTIKFSEGYNGNELLDPALGE